MKKVLNFSIIMMLFVGIMMLFPMNNVHAAMTTWGGYSTEVSASWTNSGDSSVVSPTQKIVGTAITVIRVVGAGIAIIMLTYVAIKYMSAAPQEKADFKKSATAYIVGALVLFATSGILGILNTFATNNIKV